MDEQDRLRQRVEERLARDFLVDESQIAIEVNGGVVTLVGTVGSFAEKIVAQNTVRSVEGVRDLVNVITVKPAGSMNPTDDELKRIVEQVLSWDALVPEQDLVVLVSDGLVALTGSCSTAAQAREAERAASHIGGVRGVLNRIDVVEPELSTGDVRSAIAEALTRRAAHQAAQIGVVVAGTTVTLNGIIQSPMEKRAILGAVGHLPGVCTVRDELRLAGES